MIHKILTFLAIFFVIFGALSYNIFAKNFSNFQKKMNYNSALELSKNGKYNEALTLLPQDLEGYNEGILELKGDILYHLNNENIDESIKLYTSAQEVQFSERLEQKIAFLQNKKQENKIKKDEAKNEKKNENQGSKEYQASKKQIIEDQKNRERFLNPYRNQAKDLQKDILHLKNLIDNEEIVEIKDW